MVVHFMLLRLLLLRILYFHIDHTGWWCDFVNLSCGSVSTNITDGGGGSFIFSLTFIVGFFRYCPRCLIRWHGRQG